MISIVIPFYGCLSNIIELHSRLTNTLAKMQVNYEIIFINDNSPDNAWGTIVKLSNSDIHVKGIDLSRNFGQHYAIAAGVDNASGDWVVIMDCDLQDKPEEIEKLYLKAKDGYDIVTGKRTNRKDKFIKKQMSKLFFRVYDYFTEAKIDRTIGNFAIYSRNVVDEYRKIKERDKSLVLFTNWFGFKSTLVEVEHCARPTGSSAYTLRKMIRLAVANIVTQSNKPLKLFVKFGFFLSFISLIYGIYLIYRYFTQNLLVGWTSVMVTILFIGGLIFANIGILGLYIGRIFDEVKNRPLYIISEKIGFDK